MSEDGQLSGGLLWAGAWKGPHGDIAFERISAHVSCATFRGSIPEEADGWVARHLPRLLAGESHGVAHFIDLGELISPNSKIRNTYISNVLDHRAGLAALHCYFDASSLVNSMMVTAANIALGGLVTLHRDRQVFAALKQHAVSSEAQRMAV